MDELDELDHDVAAALGGVLDGDGWRFPEPVNGDTFIKTKRSFCRDWSYGGPIIEREKIAVYWDKLAGYSNTEPWVAGFDLEACDGQVYSEYTADSATLEMRFAQRGDAPLVAAMRAFVASKR